MQRLKYFPLIVILLILTGCGQKIDERVNLRYEPIDAPGIGRTIVVLPFADYSYSDNLASSYRRNLKVTEALTDNLTVQGFSLPVSEDVFQYLVDENIIRLSDYEKNSNVSLTNELAGDWSNIMKNEIRHYLRQQQITQRNEVGEAPGTHALTEQEVAKLGRKFRADYVVRGRILEFRTRQEVTWEPWRRGIFPFISGGSAQALFGFAGSDSYDTINQMVASGIVGAVGGSISDWPIDEANIELFGDGGATGNEIFWATGGGALGAHASKSGKVDQAVVQLRMWVQEASSGEVIWTNRAMVRVAPESVFADGQYDDLFNTAIERGISSLVESFTDAVL